MGGQSFSLVIWQEVHLPVGRLGTRRILVYRTQHNLSLAVARDILGSLTPSTTLPHGAGANLLLPVVLGLVL